jgi:DNA-binding transcriptional ArsR family regulator
MTAPHSLTRLFPNPAVLDVLALLLLHPRQQFYQSEIADRTKTTILQAQRALRRIQDAGLVETSRRGNRVYYAVHLEHPAYEDLKRVLIKTVGLGDQLRDALQPLRDRVLLSFIFGSVASGSESATSDVDLILVGELSSRQVAKILGPLGRQLGRELNPVIYPREEFRSKARRGNQFVREIMSGPKIWLVGSDHELAQLVE